MSVLLDFEIDISTDWVALLLWGLGLRRERKSRSLSFGENVIQWLLDIF